MRIGIFGGTFDPFTAGHLAIVQKAATEYDRVIIVPTICNYYRSDKRYLFTFDEKCRIIQEMINGISGDVIIDNIEKNQDSKWRTINTVEYFKKIYPNDELFLIIGQDSLENFETWFRYDDILNLVKLSVVHRGNNKLNLPYEEMDILDIGDAFLEGSSSKVRNKLIEELMDMYLSDWGWYNDNKD